MCRPYRNQSLCIDTVYKTKAYREQSLRNRTAYSPSGLARSRQWLLSMFEAGAQMGCLGFLDRKDVSADGRQWFLQRESVSQKLCVIAEN